MEYSLMNDYMFKKYFSNEKNLRGFLKLLEIPIGEDEIKVSPIEVKDSVLAKGSRMDVRVVVGNKGIDVEGQNQLMGNESYHAHREIHYVSQIHAGSYKEGELYSKEYNSYVIFINDFVIPGYSYYTRKRIQNEVTKEYYNDIVILDISLKRSDECANMELREMLQVLSTKAEKSFKTKQAQEAMTMIKEWNEDELEVIRAQNALRSNLIENTFRELARQEGLEEGRQAGLEEGRQAGLEEGRQAGLEEGRQAGLEEGREEGMTEAIATIVKTMYGNGLSIEDISAATNLPIDAIMSMISK